MQIMLTLQRRGGILKNLCNKKTEVYSRVVGYYRPVQNWNLGKKEEYRMRKTFKQDIDLFTIKKNNIVFKEGSKCKYNLITYEFVEIFELGSFAFFDDKTGQNEVWLFILANDEERPKLLTITEEEKSGIIWHDIRGI